MSPGELEDYLPGSVRTASIFIYREVIMAAIKELLDKAPLVMSGLDEFTKTEKLAFEILQATLEYYVGSPDFPAYGIKQEGDEGIGL